jgi:hypothetical protein
LTNPTHQWPDPTLFTNAAGQALSGTEVRNLNRHQSILWSMPSFFMKTALNSQPSRAWNFRWRT